MVAKVMSIAKQTTATHLHEELGDASIRSQIHRWGHKPLQTFHPKYASFKSFAGRLYCAKELFYTTGREVYRAGKNALLVAEKILNFIREFFQTLFKEKGYSWSHVGKLGKDILSASLALPARVLTYVLDIAKLSVGVLIPRAAIHSIIKIHIDDLNGNGVIDPNEIKIDLEPN